MPWERGLIKPVQLGGGEKKEVINGQSLKSKSKVHAVPRGPETHKAGCDATHTHTHINYPLVCMRQNQVGCKKNPVSLRHADMKQLITLAMTAVKSMKSSC